jgi:hypothetical protein
MAGAHRSRRWWEGGKREDRALDMHGKIILSCAFIDLEVIGHMGEFKALPHPVTTS